MSAADTTVELWQIASTHGNLTDEQLEECARMTNEGCGAFFMAEVLDGIGGTFADDENKSLSSKEAAALLSTISDHLNTLGAREFIASDAAWMLKARYKKRAEARAEK